MFGPHTPGGYRPTGAPPPRSESSEAARGKDFLVPIRTGIRFENVSFTYPDAAAPALEGITFEIRAGEKLAVVGQNGAGKSTLVRLLIGLYRPQEGRGALYGEVVTPQTAPRLRRRIAAVLQDFVSYRLTLGENVAFGDIERLGVRTRRAPAPGAARPDLSVDNSESGMVICAC